MLMKAHGQLKHVNQTTIPMQHKTVSQRQNSVTGYKQPRKRFDLSYLGALYGSSHLKKKGSTPTKKLKELLYTTTPEWKKQEEEKKLHFARFCWRHRGQLTPKGSIPWEKRFEEIYNESLDQFARRKQDEQNIQKEPSS